MIRDNKRKIKSLNLIVINACFKLSPERPVVGSCEVRLPVVIIKQYFIKLDDAILAGELFGEM
ncbi:hypothetical protein AMJ74_05475 [candidate division WOR_3 bacterium SM1_77]|uniref:Uncharacterized protein n=1 Tax=candidate division WOR_3 bacterium SM1_77 TaxID=1703778 RepID=A0A0S8JWC5_UNCW3|nr:MAG: hypothetical protein AMJ74_05475 [candidate division WOR_3 bacterium SM1_77]